MQRSVRSVKACAYSNATFCQNFEAIAMINCKSNWKKRASKDINERERARQRMAQMRQSDVQICKPKDLRLRARRSCSTASDLFRSKTE
ncbi:unnamed protein product [Onchocerca ochengi]|uniref:Secreted protein n=1 Tax=Onchocerca ochengi TaxID=42157 RepID=A0A182E399_ONCOC|nr:unnamed protein product [Onchocerca ochengi]